MEIYAVSAEPSPISIEGYPYLVKASWILIDIIACHPQLSFISSTFDSEIKLLSAEIRNELSRLATHGSIVPGLNEVERQDIKIWETSDIAPLLRHRRNPGKSEQWTAEGDEQVLFEGFARYKKSLDAILRPCILLFLVKENAKSARFVASDQKEAVLMTVNFRETLRVHIDGECVTIEHENSHLHEEFYLYAARDVSLLYCHIEAAKFYLFGRKPDRASLDDLKAYVLLHAIKDRYEDTIALLYQSYAATQNSRECQHGGSLPLVASSMASQEMESQLNQDLSSSKEHHLLSFKEPQFLSFKEIDRSRMSLFSWAVQCEHVPLVKLITDEGIATSWGHCKPFTPLGIASSLGNESLVRVLLGSVDKCGCTGLKYAVFGGHDIIVRRLVSIKAVLGQLK